MVQAPDASAILGDQAVQGMEEIAELARGEYAQGVRERMPRDFVQMYHPDGTMSIVQLPPLGKNGKGMKDRQNKIMHYMVNKKKAVIQDGKRTWVQWWYPSPPPGWKPQAQHWRCPVVGCQRAGGLPDEKQLYLHITYRHADVKELYEGTIKALKARLGDADAINLDSLRIRDAEETVACEQCGTVSPDGHEDPQAWLRGHKLGAHKEAS